MNNSFILKGTICHTPSMARLEIREDAYAVCRDGICEGVFDDIPQEFRELRLIDCTGCLVIPGMTDLHIHAPQYSYIGTGMDYELLDWLDNRTFPAENRYRDTKYAETAYGIFAEKMKRSATTRAVIFGTIHRESTLILMDLMEKSGLVTFVGKVNMDRNAPQYLLEPDAESAAEDTRRFLREAMERRYSRTKPIITPRFVISCSDALMEELGKTASELNLPVQSHLSENPDEIEFVKQLSPESLFYGDAYDRFGLFGRQTPCVMAHCVHSTEAEAQRILNNGVYVAHCPASNMNLASGIAPVRKYLDMGISVGLGTDVGAGHTVSVFRTVTEAIQVSKLYKRLVNPGAKALTFAESFYLATKGGGSFFGRVGSFEKGCEFDAVVLDDSRELLCGSEDSESRLERAFYLGIDRTGIIRKFAAGRETEL